MPSDPKKFLHKMFPTNRRLLVNQSISTIKIKKKWKKVLVVGVGNDPYRDLFGELEQYVRLDIFSDKEKVDVVADAHSLPFDRSSFDCIMAIEVFEHLEDPEKFVDESHRVLSSSGSIFLSIPFMFHEHGDPYDYSRPTKFKLEKIFSKFSQLDISSQGTRLHVILDLITTSSSLFGLLRVFRFINHLICLVKFTNETTSPSGYFIKATK
jgi:SAM-dependent methyltransferase